MSAKPVFSLARPGCAADKHRRVSKLEMLDEIEELKLVLSHYMIAWGSKGEGVDAVHL